MKKNTFYHFKQIESIASKLLTLVVKEQGKLSIPVEIDFIVEQITGLSILWTQNFNDDSILACITPWTKQILFNENRRDFIDSIPGLYETVLAHELGHWELHFDKSKLKQQSLLEQLSTPHFQINRAFINKASENKLVDWDERNAHRFSASLLIPRDAITKSIPPNSDITWEAIEHLSRKFNVTKTMMAIRLSELEYMHLGRDGIIYRSQAEYLGQPQLPL